MRMTGIDWRPFKEEFPILFGADKFISLWVGEGWFCLLWDLCVVLESIAQTRLAEGCPPLRIVQIKEKLGGLRCYVDGGTEVTHDLIAAAGIRSESICEACGKPGGTHAIHGWYKTLCPTHESESRSSKGQEFQDSPGAE